MYLLFFLQIAAALWSPTNSLHSVNSFPMRRLTLSAVNEEVETILGPPLPINSAFDGLNKVHSNPDVYVIENFLDEASCFSMINAAKEKNMQQSPVAYAGWTTDVKDLLSLAAKGPVSWLAILTAWIQTKDDRYKSESLQLYASIYFKSSDNRTAFFKEC